MTNESGRRPRRRGRLGAAVVAGALLTGGVTAAVLHDPNATSAALGGEGTRTFDHAPDDLPTGVVPDDAIDVQGIVERRGDAWSAAVTFVVSGSRDAAIPHVEAAVLAADYVEDYRSYDETVLSVVYDRDDGAQLRLTYRTIPEGTGVAVVLSGPSAGPAGAAAAGTS